MLGSLSTTATATKHLTEYIHLFREPSETVLLQLSDHRSI